MSDPTLGRQFGEVLRRWGLLDEVNNPKDTEEFVVNDLLAVVNASREQCPRSEFDGYGLQCQKPAGHNLCTFEEAAT